jgi:hypothetical protein
MHPGPDGPLDGQTRPAVPSEWTMEIYRHEMFCVVEIRRLMVPKCRLTTFSNGVDEEAFRVALARRARLWIASYMERS